MSTQYDSIGGGGSASYWSVCNVLPCKPHLFQLTSDAGGSISLLSAQLQFHIITQAALSPPVPGLFRNVCFLLSQHLGIALTPGLRYLLTSVWDAISFTNWSLTSSSRNGSAISLRHTHNHVSQLSLSRRIRFLIYTCRPMRLERLRTDSF